MKCNQSSTATHSTGNRAVTMLHKSGTACVLALVCVCVRVFFC